MGRHQASDDADERDTIDDHVFPVHSNGHGRAFECSHRLRKGSLQIRVPASALFRRTACLAHGSERVVEVDRQWGPGTAAAARDDQRYFVTPLPRTRFVAFNASRGIFADPLVRRAASLALDRSALAAAWRQAPTDQILSPALPGFRDRDLHPLQASPAKASALMHGRRGRAVMAVPPGCDECSEAAHVVVINMAAIGIDVEIRKVDLVGLSSTRAASFDLVDAESGIPYPDSASFLRQLLRDIPSGWVPDGVRAKIHRVAGLTGDRRQTAAAALSDATPMVRTDKQTCSCWDGMAAEAFSQEIHPTEWQAAGSLSSSSPTGRKSFCRWRAARPWEPPRRRIGRRTCC